MIDYRRLKTDLFAIALLAVTVFVGMSLISFNPADLPAQTVFPTPETIQNACGPVGSHTAYAMFWTFGLGAYFLLIGMVLYNFCLFTSEPPGEPLLRLCGWSLSTMAISVLCESLLPLFSNVTLLGNGGYVGLVGHTVLIDQFSLLGSAVLLGAIFTAGMLLALEEHTMWVLQGAVALPFTTTESAFRGLAGMAYRQRTPEEPSEFEQDEPFHPEDSAEKRLKINAPPMANKTAPLDSEEEEDFQDDLTPPDLTKVIEKTSYKVNPPVVSSRQPAVEEPPIEADEETYEEIEYELPPLEDLEEAEDFPYELLAAKAQEAAEVLERTFTEFGLNVKVSEIDTGPVVTQFELDLEPGLRVSKVANLADDLAIALRVPAVRVVNPIPGKNTVGVEVPNDKQVMVRLKELLENCKDQTEKMRLPLYLGKDVSGRPMVVDLTKMPHLLIAGRTGTGKSVCLNTLILSLLMTRRPDQVKMLMIDPKMVELSPYMRVPHLMNPVITDMKKAEAVLGWAVDKMEERYELLARCGVRHLDSYNQLGKEEVLDRMGIDPDSPAADDVPEQMPYIVIIADEMADMMMTSGKEVEGHIIRLAQKSRAVGIHLVLATQKPTVDVITGLIKSNLPARVSFQVASRTDSRVVLDENGAERLLGCGDMLYLAPGTSNVLRAQGTYVSDEEVNGVIDFLGQYEPQYSKEIAKVSSGESSSEKSGIEAIKERDEMYAKAVEVVISEQRGSSSLLQRALGVGYGRAAKMIDYMAEDGIVGEYNGSQAREVMYTMEQWEEMKGELEMA